MLKNSTILVTGGTGSFGSSYIRSCLKSSNYSKIIVFSRDELKQYELKQLLGDDERLRWFIGDIREQDRLRRDLDDAHRGATEGNRFQPHLLRHATRCDREGGERHLVRQAARGTQGVVRLDLDALADALTERAA